MDIDLILLSNDFILAYEKNDVQKLDKLVKRYGDPNKQDNFGQTLLMKACALGAPIECVEYIYNISDLNVVDFKGKPATANAVINMRFDCVLLFLQKEDVSRTRKIDCTGRDTFFYYTELPSIHTGKKRELSISVFKRLLEITHNHRNPAGEYKRIPLHNLVLTNDIQKVEYYLKYIEKNYKEEQNEILNWKDVYGYTPIMLAAMFCGGGIMCLLHKYGAKIDTVMESTGDTIFHLAAKHENCSNLKQLLIWNHYNPIAQNKKGDTILHVMMKAYFVCVSDKCDIIFSLYASNIVDLDAKNDDGHTALQMAAKDKHLILYSALLRVGAKFEAPNIERDVPCSELNRRLRRRIE